MLNLKKTRMKKNLFLALSIISAFIFIAGVMCTIMGDDPLLWCSCPLRAQEYLLC